MNHTQGARFLAKPQKGEWSTAELQLNPSSFLRGSGGGGGGEGRGMKKQHVFGAFSLIRSV